MVEQTDNGADRTERNCTADCHFGVKEQRPFSGQLQKHTPAQNMKTKPKKC